MYNLLIYLTLYYAFVLLLVYNILLIFMYYICFSFIYFIFPSLHNWRAQKKEAIQVFLLSIVFIGQLCQDLMILASVC